MLSLLDVFLEYWRVSKFPAGRLALKTPNVEGSRGPWSHWHVNIMRKWLLFLDGFLGSGGFQDLSAGRMVRKTPNTEGSRGPWPR